VEAEVKYVPLKDLSTEMAKYKYGFMLREKMIINEVATPTKMNSYMAAGVIPIFSNVIGDFTDVFRSMRYVIACNDDQPNHIINQIAEIEKETIAPEKIIGEYRTVFDSYYSRDKYVEEISERLKKELN